MMTMTMVMVVMMMKLTRLVSNASVTPSLVNACTKLVWKLAVKLQRTREVMIGIPLSHKPWEGEMGEPVSGSADQIFGSEDLFSASRGGHLRNKR